MGKYVYRCFLALIVSMSHAPNVAAEILTLDNLLLNIESRWATAAHETNGRQHKKA